MTGSDVAQPVRGTQLLVEHMGEVIRRPSLLAIEVGWRWLFGIPFLLVCWQQTQQVLAAYPLGSSGLDSIDTQNPWIAAVQISHGISFYEPHLLAVMRWLLPAAALVWIVISGLGRGLLLKRIDARMRFRPFTAMAFQAAWLALFALAVWGWLRAMEWIAATHIGVQGEPDLVGYFVWAIFLSLGVFTAFALASWPFSIAPFPLHLDKRAVPAALVESLRLGKPFTSKLVEINLVLGIVKLALIVLAMVFSAAPLPFSDELGSDALHMVSAASVVFYFVANDFFQVVRIKAFAEFWRTFRGERAEEVC
ncbi:MAG: hypothetical protein ABSD59_25705 [Terracidiphilus sp.]|jgi:hypothetical protein